MVGPVRGRGARDLFLLLTLLVASVAISAGRSGAADDKAEQKKVSATTVAEALKTIESASREIAGNTVGVTAQEKVEVIAPLWNMIEGTVRANDNNSYVAFENAIDDLTAAVEARDPKKAAGAAGALSSAAKFYVAKFAPGAAAATPAPARSGDSAASNGTPAPAAERSAAAAGGSAAEGAAAGALARTGPEPDLTAVAGMALGLGGLAVIAGARRRPVSRPR